MRTRRTKGGGKAEADAAVEPTAEVTAEGDMATDSDTMEESAQDEAKSSQEAQPAPAAVEEPAHARTESIAIDDAAGEAVPAATPEARETTDAAVPTADGSETSQAQSITTAEVHEVPEVVPRVNEGTSEVQDAAPSRKETTEVPDVAPTPSEGITEVPREVPSDSALAARGATDEPMDTGAPTEASAPEDVPMEEPASTAASSTAPTAVVEEPSVAARASEPASGKPAEGSQQVASPTEGVSFADVLEENEAPVGSDAPSSEAALAAPGTEAAPAAPGTEATPAPPITEAAPAAPSSEAAPAATSSEATPAAQSSVAAPAAPSTEAAQPPAEAEGSADVEMAAAESDNTPKLPPDAEQITEFSSSAENGDAATGTKPAAKESAEKDADSEQNDKPAEEEVEAGPEVEAEPPMSELEKLWKPVNDNPSDFTAWTLLIQYAEAQCFMEEMRDVLDKFLARYPYCYGYWKKYADLEKKRGTSEQCNQVFQRALTAVPLSVDLWLHYLAHVRAESEDKPAIVRAAFEHAIAACGLEFRSDRLWEQYASWETLNKDPPRALAVYKRAIAVPTLSYRTHFENLEQFVGETPPQDLLTVEEFLEARRAVLAELKESQPAPEPPPADLLPPGCDEPPPGVPSTPLLSADEEGVRLRSKILTPLRLVHKENEKQVSLRWTFEELIKRPYFHVKPLERGQLKNWKQYLDFEIEQGDNQRIIILFDRCMIACALYEEFWVKYIRYLESVEKPDTKLIRAVYERACWTHLPAKPAIHMLWATFEEKMGDHERATEIVERLCERVSLMEVQLRRINLARRRGHLDRAEQLYADALKNCTHRAEAVLVAVKFVRFLYKVRGDRAKAEEVLREAIRQDPTNVRMYQQLVDLGFQATPIDASLCQQAFKMALESPMELRDRALMAHRRCEFLEEFSNDVVSLQTAQEEYFTLARALKAEAKKKQLEGGGEGDAAASKSPSSGVKRAASDQASTNGTDKKPRTETARGTAAGPSVPSAKPPVAGPAFTQPPPTYAGYSQPPPQPYYGGYQYPQQGAPWGYPQQYPPQPGYQYPPQYGQPGYQYQYK